MPLVFVHGVNTRNTDEDYPRAVAARKAMFEQYVLPAVATRGFPDFTVGDDIYWGDLGVSFAWSLRSVPPTNITQSLGAEPEPEQNLDLPALLLTSSVQFPSAAPTLVGAARSNAPALVRAIFAVEADKFAPREMSILAEERSDSDIRKAANEGEHLGLMLIAVESFAREVEANTQLAMGETDDEVLSKIEEGVTDRYRALVEQRMSRISAGEVQHLGEGGDPIGWITNRIEAAIGTAKNVASSAVRGTNRAATLLALKGMRDGLSRRTLRFLGDAFVYLHHGKADAPNIFERVKMGLLTLDGKLNQARKREPFILVSHSFGSEIVYDLLTSGALSDLIIDLWITVGAQTSLFAEMLLFENMPDIPENTKTFALGRPSCVLNWINFYDAADVLSYLHEPVFGPDAVTDIPVRAQANVTNAHGHYFMDPGFYERIATEIEQRVKFE
jgi:hypothetical protein